MSLLAEKVRQRGAVRDALVLARDAAYAAAEAGPALAGGSTLQTWAQNLTEDILNEVLPAIVADHIADEERVNQSFSKVSQCLVNLLNTEGSALTPNIATAMGVQAMLTGNESLLPVMNATQHEFCRGTRDTLSSLPCTLPSSSHPDDLRTYLDCAQTWFQESEALHQQCDEAHDKYTKLKELCTNLGNDLRVRVCTLAVAWTGACSTYTTCRIERLGDHSRLQGEVSQNAEMRRVEVHSLAKIACFLKALMVPDLDAAALQQRLAVCDGPANLTYVPGGEAVDAGIEFPSISMDIRCPLQKAAVADLRFSDDCPNVDWPNVEVVKLDLAQAASPTDGGQGSATYTAADGTVVVASPGTHVNSGYYYLSGLFDSSNSADLSSCSFGRWPNASPDVHYCYWLAAGSPQEATLEVTFPSPRMLSFIRVRPVGYRTDTQSRGANFKIEVKDDASGWVAKTPGYAAVDTMELGEELGEHIDTPINAWTDHVRLLLQRPSSDDS